MFLMPNVDTSCMNVYLKELSQEIVVWMSI
jgi:hypothetical protein